MQWGGGRRPGVSYMRQQISFAAVVLVVACGNPRKPEQEVAPPARIEVRPSAVQLAPAAAQQFELSPSTVSVTWSVTEVTGGTITQAGLYTAPGYSGVFKVVATSTANSAVSGQAIVTVESGITITASTTPVSAVACERTTLTATVQNSSDTTVVWSVPPACGTVTPTGVFTSL